MTKLTSVFALLFFAAVAHAETVSCSGSASSSQEFVSGNCSGEFCNGYVPNQTLTSSGSCGNGVTFSFTDTIQGNFLNVQCMGGQLMGTVPGGSLSLTGTCSNGGQFSGTVFLNGGTISGTCRPGGFFNATVFGSEGSVSGECSVP